ncbi:hypothetical protein HU200_037770 [Digitaria exilis]|uniref:Uncharacterized protein n=1 Tax=Digitaria exilis TaxID=1010633 RepID=A0A835BEC5_9POAL|nr:hypothetical protein HU200_037770 [Digitaria exilis]
MAGLKVSLACIVIVMIIMPSGVASREARRLMEETRTNEEACAAGGCHSPVKGSISLTAVTQTRPTTPGQSPRIGHPLTRPTTLGQSSEIDHPLTRPTTPGAEPRDWPPVEHSLKGSSRYWFAGLAVGSRLKKLLVDVHRRKFSFFFLSPYV